MKFVYTILAIFLVTVVTAQDSEEPITPYRQVKLAIVPQDAPASYEEITPYDGSEEEPLTPYDHVRVIALEGSEEEPLTPYTSQVKLAIVPEDAASYEEIVPYIQIASYEEITPYENEKMASYEEITPYNNQKIASYEEITPYDGSEEEPLTPYTSQVKLAIVPEDAASYEEIVPY